MTYRTSNLIIAALSVLGMLGAGCQNQLKVKVEAVRGVSSSRLDPDSRLGLRLDAAIRDLSLLITKCGDVDRAMTDFVETFPTEDEQQEIAESVISDFRAVVLRTREEATRHRDECRGYYVADDITAVAPDARSTLRQVEVFFANAGATLEKWNASASRLESLRDLLKNEEQFRAFDTIGLELKLATLTTDPARRPPLGFGGFLASDVYTINPSDPKYREILRRRDLAREVLTQASVSATGDSSIMLVMEHAGQVRLYQVSNDPSQVARNVALIVGKASQAAAKYASVGLTP